MIYALDTNIVSYLLQGDVSVIPKYRQAMSDSSQIVIPPIVFYEVQRGLLARRLHKKLAQFSAMFQKILHVEFDKPVWQRAAEIYASYHFLFLE